MNSTKGRERKSVKRAGIRLDCALIREPFSHRRLLNFDDFCGFLLWRVFSCDALE
jgi:hypothetical protein